MKTKKRNYKPRPIPFEFVRRPDGRYNFWQYRVVKGHSYGRDNPVWVIMGVLKDIPEWAWKEALAA